MDSIMMLKSYATCGSMTIFCGPRMLSSGRVHCDVATALFVVGLRVWLQRALFA